MVQEICVPVSEMARRARRFGDDSALCLQLVAHHSGRESSRSSQEASPPPLTPASHTAKLQVGTKTLEPSVIIVHNIQQEQ